MLYKKWQKATQNLFEKSKKFGASYKTEELLKNYKPQEFSFSTLKALFHNTALFAAEKENRVNYDNIKTWLGIQQRCFNRSIDATKAYFDYMLQHLPKKALKLK